MKVYLAADHRGLELKAYLIDILAKKDIPTEDCGAYEFNGEDDYPDFGARAAREVAKDPENKRAVLICGSGVGMAVVANKIPGIRAGLIHDERAAKAARNDDDINVLALGSDYISKEEAIKVVLAFLQTGFSGETKYVRRLKKIQGLEEACCPDEAAWTMQQVIEIVPAILRKTREKITEDWGKIEGVASHVQIDITDGVFAGDGTFRELRWFKKLKNSEKIEIHLMAHHPGYYADDIIDLLPARCVFHLESFSSSDEVENIFHRIKEKTQTELWLAINPATPSARLDEYGELFHYVMFLGYEPGRANQPIDPTVFRKIAAYHERQPEVKIAADGHVDKGTIEDYVQAGARILCANTAIFGAGDPVENFKQMQLLAQAAVGS